MVKLSAHNGTLSVQIRSTLKKLSFLLKKLGHIMVIFWIANLKMLVQIQS